MAEEKRIAEKLHAYFKRVFLKGVIFNKREDD